MQFAILTILLAALLAADDLRAFVVRAPRRFRRNADQDITSAVLIGSLPAVLLLTLVSPAPLAVRLALMVGQLAIVGLVALLTDKTGYENRQPTTREKLIILAHTALSLALPLSPGLRMNADRKLIAKLAFFFSLPALAGLTLLALDRAVPQSPSLNFVLPRTDTLVVVLIGAWFIQLTIGFLETRFRLARFRLSSCFRLALCLSLAYCLIFWK